MIDGAVDIVCQISTSMALFGEEVGRNPHRTTLGTLTKYARVQFFPEILISHPLTERIECLRKDGRK